MNARVTGGWLIAMAALAGCTGTSEPTDAGDVTTSADTVVSQDVQRIDTGNDVVMLADNATCANAAPLTTGTPITNADPTHGGPNLSSLCLTNARGRVLYYRIAVPAGQTLLATATPSSTLDAVVRILDACGAATCAGEADRQSTGAPDTAHFSNTGTASVDAIVAVGGFTAMETGTIDVSAQLLTTPPSATCESAALVASGTTLHGEDLFTADFGGDTRCLATASGYEMFYRVHVPATQRLTVTATPMGAWNPVIRVLDSCAATACLASGDTAAEGAAETLTYTNAGADADFVVAIGASSEMHMGTFDALFSVAP